MSPRERHESERKSIATAEQSPTLQHHQAVPLESRHVFLDTQVYHALGHNPLHKYMSLLKEQVASHRVILHTTDITLLEVKRQIHEAVLAAQRELKKSEKRLNQWRKLAPISAPTLPVSFEPATLSAELFQQFEQFLRDDCKAEIHPAMSVAPASVFDTYFARRPPFDGDNSKEFPDAFVLQALSQWCEDHNDIMYVVTEDRAMTRAAVADKRLLPLKNIDEVLTRATAKLGTEVYQYVGRALNKQTFRSSLEAALRKQIGGLAFSYTGDELYDGEAYEGDLIHVVGIGYWSIVGLNKHRVTIILNAEAKVQVDVQYEDHDEAMYDNEDGRWYGTQIASTQIEDDIELEILVELERNSGTLLEATLLTQEATISETLEIE
jgi:hypothetical protein